MPKETKAREQDQTIVFPDDFKLIVRPNRISYITQPDSLNKVFHEEIEIKYFYEGSSTIMVGSESVITQPGDIIVMNPYEFHSTVDLNGQQGKYHLFLIGLDFFTERTVGGLDLRRLLIREKKCFHHLIRSDERIGEILDKIADEYARREEYFEMVIEGLLLEFFSLLLRHNLTEEQADLNRDDRLKYYSIVEPAIKKIRTSYEQKLTVDELAVLCSTSKCHFCRIFKLVTDMTVVEYTTDYRFKIADLMLAHSDKTVSQIARECGFDDASYFCRCYRKKYGISPNKNRILLQKQKSNILP